MPGLAKASRRSHGRGMLTAGWMPATLIPRQIQLCSCAYCGDHGLKSGVALNGILSCSGKEIWEDATTYGMPVWPRRLPADPAAGTVSKLQKWLDSCLQRSAYYRVLFLLRCCIWFFGHRDIICYVASREALAISLAATRRDILAALPATSRQPSTGYLYVGSSQSPLHELRDSSAQGGRQSQTAAAASAGSAAAGFSLSAAISAARSSRCSLETT